MAGNQPIRVTRHGRPSTPAKDGEKATLGVRASAALKRRLVDAGKAAGHGISHEAERRLEQSFRDDDLAERIVAAIRAERDRWNADAARLSAGLLAIVAADPATPAEVLRSIAYDLALNGIGPDIARFQIARRAAAAAVVGLDDDRFGEIPPPSRR